jgi:hypothetical protein
MELQANQFPKLFSVADWENSLKLQIEMRASEKGYEPRPGDMKASVGLAIQAAEFWHNPERQDEEIIYNETPLEFPLLDGAHLRFKPDLVFQNKHGVFHRQYKTIASKKAIPDYVRLIKQSMHEAGYRYGLVYNLLDMLTNEKITYMGTDLVCFHKDPVHAKAKGEKCGHCDVAGYTYRHPAYVRQPLRVTPQMAEVKFRQMQFVAQQILDAEAELTAGSVVWNAPSFDPREHACYTRQRRLCWAFDACREKTVTLDDDRLYEDIDPDERYKEKANEDPRS